MRAFAIGAASSFALSSSLKGGVGSANFLGLEKPAADFLDLKFQSFELAYDGILNWMIELYDKKRVVFVRVSAWRVILNFRHTLKAHLW